MTTVVMSLRPRPRRPFTPIDIPPPSPVSLPQKRAAPSSGHGGKIRKVSGFEEDRYANTTRLRGDVTPTLKRFYETDELGLGKSPARRLFVDEPAASRHGINGTATPPQPSKRTLAPSPPISTRSSPAPTTPLDQDLLITPTSPILNRIESENGADIHDPGFVIYRDAEQPPIIKRLPGAPPTPDSKRSSVAPGGHEDDVVGGRPEEDQENIAPAPSVSTPPTPKSSHAYKAFSPKQSPGSGRLRKTLERSRLGREILHDATVDDEQELTPGRRVVNPTARRTLVREVNRI